MRKLAIAAMCATVLVAGGVAVAAPDMTVLPAEVRGIVLLPDGETPVERLAVKVWNAETEEVIYRTRTNEDGVFTVPRLTEGDHYATVGPVRIDMRILTARGGVVPQAHGVVVVVPNRAPAVPVLLPTTMSTAAAALLPAAEPEPIIPTIVSP